jgi:hypothetical protein
LEKSYKNILKIIDNLGHAVVISKEEDSKFNKKGFRSKMPIELHVNPRIKQVFSRYIESQIKVCHIENKDIKSLTLDEIDKYYI